jgi:hypothetical protein
LRHCPRCRLPSAGYAAFVAEDELREKLRLGGIRRYEDVAAGHHAANVTRPTTAGALSVIPRREP